MATHTGNEGIIKIGANTVAEIRSFTITETAETVDDTVKGDTYRSKKVTFKTWTAEMGALYDPSDTTGQALMDAGTEITPIFYFIGDQTGDTYKTGSCIITEVEIASDLDGLVELSISAEGNGALTEAVVA
jgi:predicted secreted protein